MSESSTDVAIALGSNLGDRLENIRTAIKALDRLRNVSVIDFSSIYESEAHTLESSGPQPLYLNALVLVTTFLSPQTLLEACLKIEYDNGRERVQNSTWKARSLDLDIIVFGNETLVSGTLKIPHPHLAQRRFVLQPLFELRPEFHIPAPFDATVQYLLANCTDTGSLTTCVSRSSLFSADEFARPFPFIEQKR